MGVSAAVFETAGQRSEHVAPGDYTRSVNVLNSAGVSAGNMCIIGESTGGTPHKLLVFSSVGEAKQKLKSGALLDGVAAALNGGDAVPQKVYAMRANSATRSTAELKVGNDSVLTLYSLDYGTHTNRISVKVDGVNKVVTVKYSGEVFTQSFERESIRITAEHKEIGGIKVEKGKLTIQAGGDSDTSKDVSISITDDLSLADLEELVEANGYGCEVLDSRTQAKASELDWVSAGAGDILYSNVQGLQEALLNCQFIGDAVIGARFPIETTGETYFTGGTLYGTETKEVNGEEITSDKTNVDGGDYAACLDALQTCDIQIITTTSTEESVHSSIKNHCVAMSNVTNRKERTAILGGEAGLSNEAILERTKALNSRLVSFVADSGQYTNPVTGKTARASGAIVACMLAGMESAMSINEPLTNKTVNLLSVDKERLIPDLEELIKGGAISVNLSPTDLTKVVCIRGMTTYQGDNDLINCERSMVREDLYMNRDLRSVYAPSIGRPNRGGASSIIATLKDRANIWEKNGYIVAGEKGNVWNIKVRIDGDKIYLEFDRYLTAPTNFIFATVTNNVYTASVEV